MCTWLGSVIRSLQSCAVMHHSRHRRPDEICSKSMMQAILCRLLDNSELCAAVEIFSGYRPGASV